MKDFLEIPPEPVEPKIGKEPKIYRKARKEHEKRLAKDGLTIDTDPWRWESCGYCFSIIGKDYGSYSHSCREKEAYQAWYRPMLEYKDLKRIYDKAVYLRGVYDRLLIIGMEDQDARAILLEANSLFDPKDGLESTLWFLEKIEALSADSCENCDCGKVCGSSWTRAVQY